MGAGPVLIIACGALAREIVALKRLNAWSDIDVQCLPPELHNRPERIPVAVGDAIAAARARYARIFVAYADCGTGGRLDAVLEKHGVERLPGSALLPAVRHRECLCRAQRGRARNALSHGFPRAPFRATGDRGARHRSPPRAGREYFRNYTRVVYLVQSRDEKLRRGARAAAARFGLEYVERYTGYGELATSLTAFASARGNVRAQAAGNPAWQR
jgi:hypothetical protein